MPTGHNPTYISSVGMTPTRVVDQPRYRPHADRPAKPTGLDWSALAPTCTSCGTRSSLVHATTGLCATCDPAIVTTPAPAAPTPPAPATPVPRNAPRVNVDVRRITHLYFTEGRTVAAVATATGHAVGTIRRVLRADGRPLRDDRAPHGGKTAGYSPEVIDQVVALYRDHGLSLREVGRRTSMSRTTVADVLDDAGIPRRTPGATTPRPTATAPTVRRAPNQRLKDRLAELGTDSRAVKDWALRERLIQAPAVGLPPRRLVEAWAAAHQPDQPDDPAAPPAPAAPAAPAAAEPTAFTFRAQWPVDTDHPPYAQLCNEAAWDIPDLLREAGATALGAGDFDLHDSPTGLVLTYQCPARPTDPATTERQENAA